ncbi:hypothetical protein [Phragmitibacter flavus]|uniref:hypothetical protein n=1 Tax=Phragmitibacter flavus TaxID=2576071 RepID=UPI00140C7F88|nr:hypothetical protein [Phragmitibacter flavus]
MTALVDIIDDLKHLPSQDLEDAARYIHQLRETRRQRRSQSIAETAGAISGPVGDAFAAAVEECERIDENGW